MDANPHKDTLRQDLARSEKSNAYLRDKNAELEADFDTLSKKYDQLNRDHNDLAQAHNACTDLKKENKNYKAQRSIDLGQLSGTISQKEFLAKDNVEFKYNKRCLEDKLKHWMALYEKTAAELNDREKELDSIKRKVAVILKFSKKLEEINPEALTTPKKVFYDEESEAQNSKVNHEDVIAMLVQLYSNFSKIIIKRNERISTLRALVDEQQAKIWDIEAKPESTKKPVDQRTSECDSLRNSENLQKAKNSLLAMIETQKKEIHKLRDANEVLRKDEAALQELNKAQMERISSLNADILAKSSEKEVLVKFLEEGSPEKADLVRKLQSQQEECKKLSQHMMDMEAKAKAHILEVRALRDTLKQKDRVISERDAEIADKMSLLHSKDFGLVDIRDVVLPKMKKTIEENQRIIDYNEELLKKLAVQLDKTKEEITSKDATIKRLESELKKAAEEARSKDTIIEDLRDEVHCFSELTDDKDDMIGRLMTKGTNLTELNRTKEALLKEHEARKKKTNDEMLALRKMLEDKEEDLQFARKAENIVQKIAQDVKADLERKMQLITDLKGEVAAKDALIKELKAKVSAEEDREWDILHDNSFVEQE